MKKCRSFTIALLTFCLFAAAICSVPNTASAAELKTTSQAKKLAKKKVADATVTEVDKDYDNGILVFEVHLLKGKREYDLVYRASDSKLISYEWEIEPWYYSAGKGDIISKSACKKLAKKKVKNGTITSVVKDRSDGIDTYKVKMTKGSKNYELTYNARTKKLLEYGWEYSTKKSSSTKYIGSDEAK